MARAAVEGLHHHVGVVVDPLADLPVVLVLAVQGQEVAVDADEARLPVLGGADHHQHVVPVVDLGVVGRQRDTHAAGVGLGAAVADVHVVDRVAELEGEGELAAVAVGQPVLERLEVTLAADVGAAGVVEVAVEAAGNGRAVGGDAAVLVVRDGVAGHQGAQPDDGERKQNPQSLHLLLLLVAGANAARKPLRDPVRHTVRWPSRSLLMGNLLDPQAVYPPPFGPATTLWGGFRAVES